MVTNKMKMKKTPAINETEPKIFKNTLFVSPTNVFTIHDSPSVMLAASAAALPLIGTISNLIITCAGKLDNVRKGIPFWAK